MLRFFADRFFLQKPVKFNFSIFFHCRLVHREDFKDAMEYQFDQTFFPWKLFSGSVDNLLTETYESQALVLEGVESSLKSRSMPGLEEFLR